MSGIELIRVMQRTSQDVPTILITGRPEAHIEEDVRNLGVLRFFTRPFDTDQLLTALERQFADQH
jgi:FixJ family two-component response regulator